jgi:surface antigen
MKLHLLIGIALFSATLAAYGAVGKVLRDLPGVVASEEDKAIMREAVGQALESQPDEVTTGWKNPQTGSSGIIRPVATYTKDGMSCRRLRLRNTIDGQSNEWVFNFCKTPEGDWKFAP